MKHKFWNLCKQNKSLTFIIIYGILYILAFFALENREVQKINIVYSELDSLIPFCEYFIVPYFLWFVYIVITVVFFVFFCKESKEIKRFLYSFCGGMTLFIWISYIYPNGHNLRPELVEDSIFIEAVRLLYRIDTPTNILPSMHVFVTIVCSIALLRQKDLCSHRGVKQGIRVCSILIILSTMFLKQHSVVDVALALLLNCTFYILLYKVAYKERRKIGFKRKQFT